MIQYSYTMSLSSVNLTWMKETSDQYLFFDIETTGLSAARSDLYLIGYGTIINNEQFRITLLFNDDGCSEPKILAAFKEILSDYKYLVTYNGDTFNLPYIKEKYRQFRQEISFDSIISIDVYRKIRKYKKLLRMDSMKQSALESVMGMERDEFHSGGLLIDTYHDYLGTKDTQLLDMLLSHNKDDIYGLFYVSGALTLTSFFDGDFEISETTCTDTQFMICIQTRKLAIPFDTNCNDIHISGKDEIVTINIPAIHDTLKYFYKDYKNYFYLPLEQTAIHKDVACYVENAYKEKARPETAYTTKSSVFIRQNKFKMPHIFKYEHTDKDGYIELDDAFINDRIQLKEYLLNILKQIK